MQYEPRIKFFATIDADEDLIPGSAAAGYSTSALDTANLGRYYYLLEKPSTGEVEFGQYDGSLSVAVRRGNLSAFRFSASTSGLLCSFIAPTHAYVANAIGASSGYQAAPSILSDNCMAAGGGASVSSDSPNSAAIGLNAQVSSGYTSRGKSTAVGVNSTVGAELSTALGSGAVASNTSYEVTGGTAVGATSRVSTSGEVALGQQGIPHVGFVPVRAPSGVAAGGTFVMQAIGYDDGSSKYLADVPVYPRPFTPSSDFSYILRVQGTITAMADSAADYKTWDIDYLVDTTAVRTSAFTVLHNGANNPSITFSAGSDGRLSVTAPAIDGLVITGLLQVTKIAY